MPNRENYVRLSGYTSFSDNYVNENVKYKNLYLLYQRRIANLYWTAKIKSMMQSNMQSNPLFGNEFQIQEQSPKEECNPDFAILQWQS